MQKIWRSRGLIILFAFFSLASPYFRTFDNMWGSCWPPPSTASWRLGVTFVIITAGIDLSVGTVMTFSAVMTGVFITYWGLPVPIGMLGGLATARSVGLINGTVISRMKIPPFIATLGMLYAAKGLSLVISGLSAHLLQRYAGLPRIAMGSIVGLVIPGLCRCPMPC